VEACRAWEWVSDLCEDLEIDIQLVNAAQMPEITRSSKKTDKHDVEVMVDRLLITGDLPRAYWATRDERELRGLTRRLSSLRKDRRRLLHRIHAFIDARGLSAKKALFVKADWRKKMESCLALNAWLVLCSLLSQYDVVCDFMARIEARLKELLSEREDYKRLQTIVGVGPVISATILAESAGIDRFSSVRKYAAYTGLVPQVRASGGKVRPGKITREGQQTCAGPWGRPRCAVHGPSRPQRLRRCTGARRRRASPVGWPCAQRRRSWPVSFTSS